MGNHHERVSLIVTVQYGAGFGHDFILVFIPVQCSFIVYTERASGGFVCNGPASCSYRVTAATMHSGNLYFGHFSGKHLFAGFYGDGSQCVLEVQLHCSIPDVSRAVSATVCGGIHQVNLLGHVCRNCISQRGNTGGIRCRVDDGGSGIVGISRVFFGRCRCGSRVGGVGKEFDILRTYPVQGFFGFPFAIAFGITHLYVVGKVGGPLVCLLFSRPLAGIAYRRKSEAMVLKCFSGCGGAAGYSIGSRCVHSSFRNFSN